MGGVLDNVAAVLDVKHGSYLLYTSFKQRHVVVPLNGKWDACAGCWVIPASPSLLRYLMEVIPDLQLTVDAQRKAEDDQLIVDLRQCADAQICYGDDIDPYQRVGVKFLTTAGRAILADDMGIGKSCQSIRAAYEVGARKVLVVTRKSLIHNFQRQIEKWSPKDAPPIEWHVTNYEQVVRRLNELVGSKFDVVIADECHYTKNRRARRTKAIYTLTRKVPYVWLLTGRPVLNRPDELWSLLHIVDPKRFSSYWRFVETYCDTEYNRWSGGKKVVGLKKDAKELLAQDLSGVLLRRTKDVIDLPPITRETVHVRLLPQQQKIYRQMEEEFLVTLDNESYVYAPSVLAQLTRLRQITCTPALIGGPDVSAKTEALKDLISMYSTDHKIIVFTCFAGYAKLLAKELGNVPVICGDMPQKARTEAECRFNDGPDCRVLVGTIGACGEGLNLQVANLFIFTDQDWVPASIDQAEGRVYRRGQDKPVHGITLVAENTVDEHIAEVLSAKEEIIREIDTITSVVKRIKGV